MAKFEVIVGNIGMVHEGNQLMDAMKSYSHYLKLAKRDVGHAAGEGVVIMKDGEPWMERLPRFIEEEIDE